MGTKGTKEKSLQMEAFNSKSSVKLYFFSGSFFAYLRRKRSTRPAVSSNFCLPVKKGWQLEQIST